MSNLEKTIARAFLEMADGLETGSFGPRPKIALTGMGSEHGEANAMAAASSKLRMRFFITGSFSSTACLKQDKIWTNDVFWMAFLLPS